jgi:hypothetical protein
MPVGAVVGGIASIGSSILGADAAKKGAKAQARAADAATAEQRRQFDLINQQNAPYREAGTAALNQLMGLYGLNGQPADYSAFENSPDYQFALQQGQQATERSAAARGLLGSGNTLAAAQQYGQGLASQQLGNYRNSLMGLIGTGQGATQFTGQAAFNTGQSVGNNMIQAGNARASGALAGANALMGGLGGLGQAAQDYFANRATGPKMAPGWYQGNTPADLGKINPRTLGPLL